MQRLLSALASFAFALTLGGVASAQTMATSKPAMMASSKPMMMATKKPMMMATKKPMMMMKCPKGQTMVKGYTKKDGTKVAAYCRKSAM